MATEYRSVPWSSVIAGVIAAMALQIVLSLLGTALGLATLSPFTGNSFVSSASYFGVYWWIATGLISIGTGAFLSAYLSQADTETEGETVGFITWSLLNVLAALFVFLAGGGIVSGSSKVIGAASAVTSNSPSEARILPPDVSHPDVNRPENVITSKEAAKRASAGAAVTFLTLLLGLFTSVFAGKLGVHYRNPEVTILLFRNA
jgi:hypothetical protein